MQTDIEKRIQEAHPTGLGPILTKKVKRNIAILGAIGLAYSFFNFGVYFAINDRLDAGEDRVKIEQRIPEWYKITGKPGIDIAYHFHRK